MFYDVNILVMEETILTYAKKIILQDNIKDIHNFTIKDNRNFV